MKTILTLFLIVCGSFAYGQNLTFSTQLYNNSGVTQGYEDSKQFCYYLYFNPTYKQFHDDETTILRMMMQFDLHVDEKSYDEWVKYIKQKYKFTDCVIMDIKVIHKNGKDEVYTFEGFKKYLWPEGF